jgi:hypothetical protein
MKLSAATPHAKECMEKIRKLLANPKPPGNWWASEVLERYENGEPVTPFALSLAKRALNL